MDDDENEGSSCPPPLEGPLLRTCCLCEHDLRPREPFLTALVFLSASESRVAHVPFHLICHAELIADRVADELEDDGDGGDVLANEIAKHVGRIVAPLLRMERPSRRRRS